ncbi:MULTISPECIES: acyl-CoA dehydrogenase family protein [Streptomyces]|uniref:Oxidoreductase n=1 Tax=Streptomyces coelicolor (strain ATCC BAA-471 / A3(2) / M145) TaxID=100226 RepID=Q9K3F5_STRCO|nr:MULTISPECIES: acyl-CoA dehydrogenase family protein [Streptomyces]MDX2923426.1 acyl-CoA/acyl-ACP dehydrogenase [Streptomyces sp. NRRL_B-16638]MYU40811.1 acyl-CoA dehydrogenase [Streptomyces sp. SID7813]NSL80740.1 acyl-CoA/acyl-ACP dehydrogenase [Streptomyces coelicolor]QFI41507.1 acyl-CoA dehydrogenase [Streptomyces coelicolor A3(2)]QKN65157.1 acyl-CoA/acyl-ACP dehydrogenase [Streptomyces coelicolor]
MRFLERERATLAKLLPELDPALREVPLMELERPGSPGIRHFRDSGGPGLLVPEAHQGRGATALDALRVQRAIGSRSPSLAVATTMHHFSMATLVGLGDGLEWMLIEGVASSNRVLASGFAEGRSGAGTLDPSMTATVTADGIRINGVKRPCSLAHSMDVLTASVMIPREDGQGDELAVALVPAESEGLSVSGFWSSAFLAGAESEQVTLTDVLVPPELLLRTATTSGEQLDELQTAGLIWFETLMTGSYLGAASALVERVLLNDRIPEYERVRLFVETEAAMATAECVARRIDAGDLDESALAQALYVRYGVQDAIARVVPRAVELLGGLNFMTSDEVGHLAACANGLSLHPPARSRMTAQFSAYLADRPLAIA